MSDKFIAVLKIIPMAVLGLWVFVAAWPISAMILTFIAVVVTAVWAIFMFVEGIETLFGRD